MKSISELRKILSVVPFNRIDAHSLRSVGNVGYYGTFLQA